jgi:hypothetical protein
MAKHLLLGTDTTANWRLPADSDVEAITERLKTAMETGTVERITVEMNDDPLNQAELLVNGNVVACAAVVELPEL